MIDMFTLLMVHGLMFVALFRVMMDETLDSEDGPAADPDEEVPGA